MLPQADGPAFVCIGYNSGIVTAVATDPKNPRVFGKPAGMDIGLKVAYTNVCEALPAPSAFNLLPDETTTEFEVIIPIAMLGKLISLKGTYKNARGEEGNEGFTFMMVV